MKTFKDLVIGSVVFATTPYGIQSWQITKKTLIRQNCTVKDYAFEAEDGKGTIHYFEAVGNSHSTTAWGNKIYTYVKSRSH